MIEAGGSPGPPIADDGEQRSAGAGSFKLAGLFQVVQEAGAREGRRRYIRHRFLQDEHRDILLVRIGGARMLLLLARKHVGILVTLDAPPTARPVAGSFGSTPLRSTTGSKLTPRTLISPLAIAKAPCPAVRKALGWIRVPDMSGITLGYPEITP